MIALATEAPRCTRLRSARMDTINRAAPVSRWRRAVTLLPTQNVTGLRCG